MKFIIDEKTTYQTFEGFGASGAWWAQVVGAWDHPDPETGIATNKRIAELLYSKDNGIGLSIYRYNLGGGSKNSGSSVFPNKNRMAESFEDINGGYDWSRDKNAVHMMELCVSAGAREVIIFSNSPPESLTKNHKSCLDKPWRCNLPRKNEENFVIVSVNGRSFKIMKGVEVEVPAYVAEVLDNNRRMAEEARRFVEKMAE